MLDAVWTLSDKGEIYFNGSLTQTDAAFDALTVAAAFDVPTQLFPGGQLPVIGPDPTLGNGRVDDLDFTEFDQVHDYSNLDYTELRTTLGFRYQINDALGLFASVSRYDLEDDEPMFENPVGLPDMDATGSVTLVSGGLTWSF